MSRQELIELALQGVSVAEQSEDAQKKRIQAKSERKTVLNIYLDISEKIKEV